MSTETKPPLPPFTKETAIQKIRMAEDAWNSQDPDKVKMAYTKDSVWRNRDIFLQGRDEIREFLSGKWDREQECKNYLLTNVHFRSLVNSSHFVSNRSPD